MKPSQVNYGCFPRAIIDPEIHKIKTMTEGSEELFRQWDAMQKA